MLAITDWDLPQFQMVDTCGYQKITIVLRKMLTYFGVLGCPILRPSNDIRKEPLPRPVGLNTVSLLRAASNALNLGPKQTMKVAEDGVWERPYPQPLEVEK